MAGGGGGGETDYQSTGSDINPDTLGNQKRNFLNKKSSRWSRKSKKKRRKMLELLLGRFKR